MAKTFQKPSAEIWWNFLGEISRIVHSMAKCKINPYLKSDEIFLGKFLRLTRKPIVTVWVIRYVSESTVGQNVK